MVWNPNYKWANPAANWQKTYQSSSWYQPRAQMPQMPQQQNPYQGQMQQQMPQQMPQFSQQQLNSFFNFMQRKPISSFMNDPRYQPVQYANTWQAGEFVPRQDIDNKYSVRGNGTFVMGRGWVNPNAPAPKGTGLGFQ
jgi:hypothetical protein